MIVGCLAVDLVVLPWRDPLLRWNGFDLGARLPSQIATFAGYLSTLGIAFTIVALAVLFGRRSSDPIPTQWRTALDGFVVVWLVAAIASAVAFLIDFGAPVETLVRFLVPGLVVTLVSIRVLWLVPAERRHPGRPVSFIDRSLAVALVLAIVIEAITAVDSTVTPTVRLFLWASMLPIINAGAALWLLASPHPRPMRGRDIALAMLALPVVATVGFYSDVHFFGGGLRNTIGLVTILIPFVLLYLAYSAWEHVENETVEFDEDGQTDWTTGGYELTV